MPNSFDIDQTKREQMPLSVIGAPVNLSRTLNSYYVFWKIFLCLTVLFTFLFLALFIIIVIAQAFILIPIMGGIILFLTICTAVFQYLILYHCWKLIPADIARTTPGKAVGFLLIPIFNLYWMFIAYYGLSKDMNKTFQRYGVQFHVNGWQGLAYCILFLVFFVLHHSFPVAQVFAEYIGLSPLYTFLFPFITVLVAGLACIFFLIAFLRSVKNGAITLLKQGREIIV